MDPKSKSQADILPGGAPPPPRRARLRFVLSVVALTALLRFFFFVLAPTVCHWHTSPVPHHNSAAGVCPQEFPLVPSKNGALWDELTASHATTAFRDRAVAQLSAAVQIPTETFDGMGPVGEDERWLSRGPFLEHLASAFPLV
jgi:Gly-Xaa carboxypeptidase